MSPLKAQFFVFIYVADFLFLKVKEKQFCPSLSRPEDFFVPRLPTVTVVQEQQALLVWALLLLLVPSKPLPQNNKATAAKVN